jgi:extradiol dioxygenase family protein
MNTTMPPFHVAIPVDDLEAARGFYVGVLGCGVGRDDERWIDFDFFGHQVTCHLTTNKAMPAGTTPVDGHRVPVRHFGVVLSVQQWDAMRDRLRSAKVHFLIEPHTRFPGRAGEQRTLFVRDPAGNALEFKAFADPTRLFAR